MHCDRIIDQQLARTRRRVKLVDLGTLAMGLVGAVIIYTLALVIVDHWVIDLGTTGRFLALGVLLLGAGYYCARWVFPLLVRSINPGYAARAIEQSDPSLKNSLINFLMFRRDPTPTGRLVYRALQQRAALDLRQVNIDLAVDQSRLIHLGYVVVALMVLFAGYTIFSPKDVFQTVKRVSLPWADIARPSRVTIDKIQPGDAKAVLGSQIEISARILGAEADDTVQLLYSTEDKQTVDQAVPMKPPETGQLYRCTIPANTLGIQQNLRYRIEAGDAKSAEFQLTMLRVPSIMVDKIEYQPPSYTKLQPYSTEGEGEIRALEGTTVTVHAKANHPIRSNSAEIHFDPGSGSYAGKVPMDSDGHEARGTFTLIRDEHSSYQLAFKPDLTVATGIVPPAEHKIVVTPDLPPEISILMPRSSETDVPANGTQRIEIRALDPDFGLTEITLQAKTPGREDLTQTFPQQGRTGQVLVDYDFRPADLNLQPGDRVTLWAGAKDNRPQPNSARTSNYYLNIVAADPQSATQSGQGENADNPSGRNEPSPQQSDSQPDGSENQAPADGQQPQEPQPNQTAGENSQNQQQPDQPESSQAEQSQTGQNGDQSESADQGNEGESGNPSGPPQSAQQGDETEGNQTGEGGQQEDGAAGGDAGNQQAGNQGGSSGASGSAGASDGSAGSDSGTANGQQPSSSSDSSQGAQRGTATQDATGQPSDRQEPLHEGEAIERMMDYLKNADRQENPADGSPSDQESTENAQKPTDPNGKKATDSQQNPPGRTGDQTPQDSTQGSGDTSQQTPTATGAEKSDGGNPSDPPRSPNGQDPTSSDSAADQPGKKTEPMAGEGDNNDPQQGSGEGESREGSQDPRPPKGTEGSESTNNTDPGSGEKQPGSGEKQPGQGDEGDAGKGRPSDDETGAVESQKANRDRTKEPGQGDQASSETDAQSPSQSQQQSDSQSGQGGDKSGGGEKGGGQSANQPGRDSPGSNTSSDQGNRGSPESGQGETADRAGNKQPAPDKTGQNGNDPGDGSQSQSSSDGNQVQPDGAEPTTPQQPVDPSKIASPQDASQQNPNNTTSGGMSSGNPDGGGIASDSMSLPSDSQREIAAADAANLEHAGKATDLVLERLKDQQDEPDPELLESLGWTKAELQAFIERWETMKRNARERGGESEEELQDALRSLGLRPTGPGRRASNADNDQYRGLRDSGNPVRPPAEIMEQFDAYRKGAARGQHSGG